MKRQILKRLSAFALAMFIFFPCLVVSSFAVDPATISAGLAAVGAIKEATDISDSVSNSIINAVDFTFPLYDQVDDAKQFYNCISNFNMNGWFRRALVDYPDVWETVKIFYSMTISDSVPNKYLAKPKLDEAMQCYRPAIKNPNSNSFPVNYIWLVDKNGRFPYCPKSVYEAVYPPTDSFGGNVPTQEISTSPTSTNKWRYVADGDIDLASFSVVGLETLSKAAQDLGLGLTVRAVNINGKMVKKYYIYKPENGGAYFCDSKGHPYAADVDKSTTAIENNWGFNSGNVTTIVGDGNKVQQEVNIDASNNTADNSQHLSNVTNITAGKFYVVNDDGTVTENYIDNLYYDNSTNTYHADTYNYTYNTTNNFYEFNYYTYNIQYTYNNTYVTYIGSTAEYQPKEWALYYELPDGRSSADLTEEDIAGLSFQFQDMVNYKRSATDTSLRALYHFDGNVEDSSYWSTQGSFNWNSGASITYMESNAFNGALYLDEKAHQFTITLPSNIGSQDFSIQWRYYQNSATTTEHNENYITVGGQKLLGWSEQSLYSLGSTKLSTGLSIGTWQELALVRNGSTLYIYHNGVRVASASMPKILNNKIVFYLGANSRAYSMLDELRVVNFAIAKGGASYTPTAVPYDTNNVLVLPGGSFPVADEYYKWDTTIKPVFSLNCENLLNFPEPFRVDSSVGYGSAEWQKTEISVGDILLAYDPNVSSDGNILTFQANSTPWGSNYGSYIEHVRFLRDKSKGPSAAVVLGVKVGKHSEVPFSGTYTLTVVGDDLTRYSIPLSSTGLKSGTVTASFDFGDLIFRQYCLNDDDDISWGSVALLVFKLKANASLGIRYIEIVPGTKANTGHEFVSCIYDSTELKANTAAIQSTIPVKGYTVGGVRPTFPERGDVWMPAEGSRISGVYIYNGQAWEETNARYWTGKRWIPIYAFDLVTLQDMWDVSSSTGDEITPSITSEYGFWNWWKNAWNDFTAKLFPALGTGSGGGGSGPGSGSGTIPDSSLPGEPGEGEDDGWSVFDLLIALKDGAWAIVTGTVKTAFGGIKGVVGVVTDIGGFFTSIGEVTDTIKDFGG
ncbi:MAG: LamG domain-containing protein [Oscillospiraceae bacterium]|nr:LamG domain-containing protein [Oscillospiraceae bacterium]